MKLLNTLLAATISFTLSARAQDIGKWQLSYFYSKNDGSLNAAFTLDADKPIDIGGQKVTPQFVIRWMDQRLMAYVDTHVPNAKAARPVTIRIDQQKPVTAEWDRTDDGTMALAPRADLILALLNARGMTVGLTIDGTARYGLSFDVHGLDQIFAPIHDTLPDIVAAMDSPKAPSNRPASAATAGIVLDVKNTAAKRSVVNDFVTDYGSYDKTYTRERTIEISVHALRKTPVPAACRVFWIGKRGVGNDRLILGESVAGYTENNAPHVFQESSGQFESTDLNLNAIGVRRTGGERIEGWAVLIENPDTGDLLASRCSDPYLDALLRSGDLERLGRGPLAKFMPKPLNATMAKVKEHPRLLPGNAITH